MTPLLGLPGPLKTYKGGKIDLSIMKSIDKNEEINMLNGEEIINSRKKEVNDEIVQHVEMVRENIQSNDAVSQLLKLGIEVKVMKLKP
ncbi:unnamed protein product [Linum trigynum]|uniref:Uncharacterized protein n=1 Tax=Linum trigynum TaxID=586398 RepID=A0AAV2E2D9_9ROSI